MNRNRRDDRYARGGWVRGDEGDRGFDGASEDDAEAWYADGDENGTGWGAPWGAGSGGGMDRWSRRGYDRQGDWARGRGQFGGGPRPRDWNRSGSYADMVESGSGWAGGGMDRGVHGGRFGSGHGRLGAYGDTYGRHRWGASDWMEQAGRERNSRRFGGGPGERGGDGEGSFAGRGPAGYQRSSERILEDANEALTWASRVDATHVEVTVDGAEVTLEGSVGSRREKRAAEDAVEDVRGVRDVHNRLRVRSDGRSGSRAGSPEGFSDDGE